MNMQHYRHGGGLLIMPQTTLDGLNVKYKIRYDRLLKSLRAMVENQLPVGGTPAVAPTAERTPRAALCHGSAAAARQR